MKTKILPNISENISKMDECTLRHISGILDKLPSDKTTSEILLNISKMDEDTLKILFNDITKVSYDYETMKVLRKFGVLPQTENNDDEIRCYSDDQLADFGEDVINNTKIY